MNQMCKNISYQPFVTAYLQGNNHMNKVCEKYALGCGSPPKMPITNKGLGRDPLLQKNITSSWWWTASWAGRQPKICTPSPSWQKKSKILSSAHRVLFPSFDTCPLAKQWTNGNSNSLRVRVLHTKWRNNELAKWESSWWWLNQPIWKKCSSSWIISPGRGEK